MYTKVKSPAEIEAMRESGRMTAIVLNEMNKKVAVGATTQDMANIAFRETKGMGVEPAFLGYQGFPSVICISVNEEIVHGIPSDREIKQGDLVSFDFGVNYKGMITDSAFTIEVGSETKEKQRLLKGTEESLMAGIKVIKGETHLGDIGEAVQKVLEKYEYGIVRDMVGHGVGHAVHEEPNIPNVGTKGQGDVMEPGMTIAIEPMATIGDYSIEIDKSDGWTVRTLDKSLSAHFEHTILITDDGHEILTSRKNL